MLDLYQVSEQERDDLIAAAYESRKPNWWRPYSGVIAEPLHELLGLEAVTSSLKVFEASFVSGLLQTESYTRALMLAAKPNEPEERREKRIELRMMRQRILTEDHPSHYWAIIEETAIRRPVGGPKIMSVQLDRLTRACQLAHVCIQVTPLSVGARIGMNGPFTILEFSEEQDLDVVYVESQAGCFYLEEKEGVESY